VATFCWRKGCPSILSVQLGFGGGGGKWLCFCGTRAADMSPIYTPPARNYWRLNSVRDCAPLLPTSSFRDDIHFGVHVYESILTWFYSVGRKNYQHLRSASFHGSPRPQTTASALHRHQPHSQRPISPPTHLNLSNMSAPRTGVPPLHRRPIRDLGSRQKLDSISQLALPPWAIPYLKYLSHHRVP
jgi:hypothetical protein